MTSAVENGGKGKNFFRRKIKFVDVFIGLFIVFIVPLVLCEPDRSRYLTYDNIYNSTKYAQLQSSRRPLPHNISFINPVYKYFVDNKENSNKKHGNYTNDVEFEGFNPHVKFKKERDKNKGKLLVGFSHDPYRISIPEADYAKGMRQPDPNSMKLDTRGKRGVSHLYNMIFCATGCDPLIYKGYGCYCGFLGNGRYADSIDRCCKMHDECYESIYCPFYTVYFQPYYWKCYHNEPLCAIENHLQSERVINGCAARLCDCDRRLAMCLRRYGCPKRRALCHSSPLRLLQNILMPY